MKWKFQATESIFFLLTIMVCWEVATWQQYIHFQEKLFQNFNCEMYHPLKLDEYETTVSSIWWGSASLDRENKWLNFYFKTQNNKSEIKRFNLKELKFEEEMELNEE